MGWKRTQENHVVEKQTTTFSNTKMERTTQNRLDKWKLKEEDETDKICNINWNVCPHKGSLKEVNKLQPRYNSVQCRLCSKSGFENLCEEKQKFQLGST